MYLGWPQIIYICLSIMGLTVTLIKHGEPDRHNFWITCIAVVIGYSLLIWGGFFTQQVCK